MSTLHYLERYIRNLPHPAFVPYITAGCPNLELTKCLVKALEQSGADIVEIGVPFSDSVADGPINQRAASLALEQGTSLKEILTAISDLRAAGCALPIVLFSYFNPIFVYGVEKFSADAAECGVNGVLIVDLPPESGTFELEEMNRRDLATILLASPTTTEERLRVIDRQGSGFVYYVSTLGVTGKRHQLSPSLNQEILNVRHQTTKPLFVGFGVSSTAQAKNVAQIADGVIVGSALMELAIKHGKSNETIRRVSSLSQKLSSAVHDARKTESFAVTGVSKLC